MLCLPSKQIKLQKNTQIPRSERHLTCLNINVLSARYWLRSHGTVAPPGQMSRHGSPPDRLPVSVVCWIGGLAVSSDSAGVTRCISRITRCSVKKEKRKMILLKFQLMLESHVDWNYDKLFLKEGYGNSQSQNVHKNLQK